jgi:hypothetical protein
MNLNLLRDGHINPQQAFVSLNQMSPVGAARPAHETDVMLGFDREGEYATRPSKKQREAMDVMLATERETLAHWLSPRSQSGDNQLFSNDRELGDLLRSGDLPGHIVRDVQGFYGLEED